MRRDLETLKEFFFGFFRVFFWEGVRERRVLKKREKEDRPKTIPPSLPNVRVGREVMVDRIRGAEEARADGGEERVDLLRVE